MLLSENNLFCFRFAKQSYFTLAVWDIINGKYRINYLIASLASPKLSPPTFNSDVLCACSVHVELSQWPFVQGFPIFVNWRDALVVHIRYCKIVLNIGQNGGFCASIRTDDLRELVVELDRFAELCGNADLHTICDSGVYPY